MAKQRLILWVMPLMHVCGVGGQLSVGQSPEQLSVSEGQDVTMSCNYSSSIIDSLHWYRQAPGERPVLLLMLFGTENKTQEPNFRGEHDPAQKRSSLNISGCELGNAARYFCAVTAQ